MQRKWGLRWAAFLAAVVIGFTALEVPALVDSATGDTLSEFIRMPINAAPEVGGTVLIAGAGWFVWHILRKTR